MPLSPVQNAKASYTLTANDLTNGYAVVPLTWPEPFADLDYNIVWGINDTGDPSPSVDYAVGDVHSKTFTGCQAVVDIPAAIPLIQGQEDLVASTTATNVISLTAPFTTLYQVTLYYGPSRTSALDAGKTWTPTITWTDPSGNVLTASGSSPTIVLGPAAGGNTASYGVNYLQAYSIPIFVLGGATISVTGTYSGGSFPVNVSVRVVQMPNNTTVPSVGTSFEVEAVAIHN